MLQIVGQLVEAESFGNAAHSPWLGDRLEPAHQQLARVLLEIGATIGVAQHRHAGRKAGHWLGDDIKVLCRVQRHRAAGPGAEFVRPHAGAVDHGVGAQDALRGANADRPAVLDQDFLDPGVLA